MVMLMKSTRNKDLIFFAVTIAVVVLVNVIATTKFFRWDLTEEKR